LDDDKAVQVPFTVQKEDKTTFAKKEADTGFWMIQAVLNRNATPTEIELKNTEALIPATTMLTDTDALPTTPVVGVGVEVGTAVIDDVGELVTVDVAV
jgi:hypothetical protein